MSGSAVGLQDLAAETARLSVRYGREIERSIDPSPSTAAMDKMKQPLARDRVMAAMSRAVGWREELAAPVTPARPSGDTRVGAWLKLVGA